MRTGGVGQGFRQQQRPDDAVVVVSPPGHSSQTVAPSDGKRPRLDGAQQMRTSLHPLPPSFHSHQGESDTHPQRPFLQQFVPECALGRGTFGIVYKAVALDTGREVAIKSIKSAGAQREIKALQWLRGSPNVVMLLGTFQSDAETVNLVFELLPDTLQRIIKHHKHMLGNVMELSYARLYAYQLLRGLASLRRHGVIHRDIKPANLLIDPGTLVLKVCDFGSAKTRAVDEPHQPYMCSRYYRAPELILSAVNYTEAVDIWSAGCVLAEMLIGQPVFPGKDGVDQFGRIIEVLGTPSVSDIQAMNPHYDAAVCFQPCIEALPWGKVLGPGATPEAADLTGALLRFDPSARPRPLDALGSEFFDGLRRDAAAQLDEALYVLTALSQEEVSGCPDALLERLGIRRPRSPIGN
mmetsp:Transcript_41099/g.113254  ORF Transcript_41099/g.113254 Transcript_41099/m.113254 type:complete len:409 (-) Transcript_41099:192-1418(-)